MALLRAQRSVHHLLHRSSTQQPFSALLCRLSTQTSTTTTTTNQAASVACLSPVATHNLLTNNTLQLTRDQPHTYTRHYATDSASRNIKRQTRQKQPDESDYYTTDNESTEHVFSENETTTYFSSGAESAEYSTSGEEKVIDTISHSSSEESDRTETHDLLRYDGQRYPRGRIPFHQIVEKFLDVHTTLSIPVPLRACGYRWRVKPFSAVQPDSDEEPDIAQLQQQAAQAAAESKGEAKAKAEVDSDDESRGSGLYHWSNAAVCGKDGIIRIEVLPPKRSDYADLPFGPNTGMLAPGTLEQEDDIMTDERFAQIHRFIEIHTQTSFMLLHQHDAAYPGFRPSLHQTMADIHPEISGDSLEHVRWPASAETPVVNRLAGSVPPNGFNVASSTAPLTSYYGVEIPSAWLLAMKSAWWPDRFNPPYDYEPYEFFHDTDIMRHMQDQEHDVQIREEGEPEDPHDLEIFYHKPKRDVDTSPPLHSPY